MDRKKDWQATTWSVSYDTLPLSVTGYKNASIKYFEIFKKDVGTIRFYSQNNQLATPYTKNHYLNKRTIVNKDQKQCQAKTYIFNNNVGLFNCNPASESNNY